ncbi:MAG: TIGR02147 family protein [Bdellovibrionota bacterium]
MKVLKTAPIVTEYLDVISYLQDYYHWRKATNPDFSYEYWSEELEFKSRSYIRMMIMGKKKVSKKFCEVFCRLNFIRSLDEEYFFYLVKHSQATNQSERKVFGAKLMQLLRNIKNTEVINDPPADFISDPALPRLFTLLGLQDINPTAKNLAHLMSLTLAEVNAYLEKLEELTLASRSMIDDEIHWLASPQGFKIPDNHGNMNLFKFHEHSLNDAVAAFHQPSKVRRYRSLLLPLSQDELNQLYSFLDDFASEQLSRFDNESYKGRRLFQMNLNIHPVTNEALEVET